MRSTTSNHAVNKKSGSNDKTHKVKIKSLVYFAIQHTSLTHNFVSQDNICCELALYKQVDI